MEGKEIITVETQQQAVAVRELDDLLPMQASQKAIQRIEAYKHFAKEQMKFGDHFDVLPQEQWKCRDKKTEQILADPEIKKFMTQGGADMWLSAWGLGIETEVVSKVADFDKPFFEYKVRVWLVHPQTGTRITSQVASCNSNESKYRWRWLPESEVKGNPDFLGLNLDALRTRMKGSGSYAKKLYRVPNPDLADVDNTIFQQAEKRGKVKVVRCFFNLTGYFNQPIEEVQAAVGDESAAAEDGEGQQGTKKRPAPSSGKGKAPAFSKEVLDLQEYFDKACEGLDTSERALAEQQMWEASGVKGWSAIKGKNEGGDVIYDYIAKELRAAVRQIKSERASETSDGESQGTVFDK